MSDMRHGIVITALGARKCFLVEQEESTDISAARLLQAVCA